MKCIKCDNNLTKIWQKKFCSKSCAAKYNNVKFPKRKKEILESNCTNCNKKFTYLKSSYGKFCSINCYRNYQKKLTEENFSNGLIECKKVLRKILILKFGSNCKICNQNNIWNNKLLTLQVDHIDGNSDNNKPNNLRLVCPNCHSQLSTSKGGIENKKFTKRNIIQHRRTLGGLRNKICKICNQNYKPTSGIQKYCKNC